MSEFPNIASCDPRQCIASRILKCNRIITGIFRQHLKPYNLTNSQLSVLFILSKRGSVSQQVLSEMLFLEKSTISRNMKRLLDAEYIVKHKGKLLEITTNGKVFLESVIPAWDNAMNDARKRLSNEGDEALSIVLNQLINPKL